MVSMMAHRAARCLCRCQCTVERRAFLAEPSAKPTERVNSQASFSLLVGLHQLLGDFVLAVQVRARDSARNTRLVVQGVGLPKAPAPETIMSNCSIHYSVYKSIKQSWVIVVFIARCINTSFFFTARGLASDSRGHCFGSSSTCTGFCKEH